MCTGLFCRSCLSSEKACLSSLFSSPEARAISSYTLVSLAYSMACIEALEFLFDSLPWLMGQQSFHRLCLNASPVWFVPTVEQV